MWQRRAVAEASAQPESGHGELIEYWLRPRGQQTFDGQVRVAAEAEEPYGPYCVSDPRLNNGTLTDEQIMEYVVMTHGEAPLMWQRSPWGDGEEEETEGAGLETPEGDQQRAG